MNERLKIVLDTNIFLVSLASTYHYHWIFSALIAEKYELCVSTEILLEYQEIISSRYGISNANSKLDFLLFLPNVIQINPQFRWNLFAKDPDDNKFVDCAVAANADYIVSNDKGFLALKEVEFPPLTILNYAEFEIKYKEKLCA